MHRFLFRSAIVAVLAACAYPQTDPNKNVPYTPGAWRDDGYTVRSRDGRDVQVLGALSAKQFGAVYFADQFVVYANADGKINACIAAVVAAGGGVCDAQALNGPQTMTQTIYVGDAATHTSVRLIIPVAATWTWDLRDGTSCGIYQYGNTSIEGGAVGAGGGAMLLTTAGASTNMDSVYCTDAAPPGGAGAGAYIRASGFQATNTLGTLTTAALHWRILWDNSRFERVTGRNVTGDACHIDQATSGTVFDSIHCYGSGSGGGGVNVDPNAATGHVLVIGGGNTFQISNSSFNGPGPGKYNIYFTATATPRNALLQNVYMEKYGTHDFTTAMVRIDSGGPGNIIFQGGHASPMGCSAGCAQVIFENRAYAGITIRNFGVDVNTSHGVNDIAYSRTWDTDGIAIREYSSNASGTAWLTASATLGTNLSFQFGGGVDQWTPSQAIVIESLEVTLSTAPAGCSTYPKVSITNNAGSQLSPAVAVQLTNGGGFAYTASGLAVPIAAGATIKLNTAGGVGCTTWGPGFLNAHVTYHRQP